MDDCSGQERTRKVTDDLSAKLGAMRAADEGSNQESVLESLHKPKTQCTFLRSFIGTKIILAEPAVREGQHGYRVIYEDGYESWSPKQAFESAYQDISGAGMSFGHALVLLKIGHLLTRNGWNGDRQWIALQRPDENSKMRKPYIYMNPVDGELVSWLASQTDMLADDWRIA